MTATSPISSDSSVRTPVAEVPISLINAGTPEAVLALAHLQLEKIRDASKKDRLQAKAAAEKEARIAIKQQRKAAKLGMIQQFVVSAISIAATCAPLISDKLKAVFEKANKVLQDGASLLVQATKDVIGAGFGKRVADLEETAAEHNLAKEIHETSAGECAESAQSAQGYSDRALSHIQAVSEAANKAREAALV